jgi:hypothetical protein
MSIGTSRRRVGALVLQGGTVGSASVANEFLANADRVWAALGDFAHPGTFISDLQAIEMQGNVRVLTLPGTQIRERLLERDDVHRRLVYSILAGLPIESHRGEINVLPTETGCKVTWDFEVTPEEMVGPLTEVYTGALVTLKHYFGEE